MTIAGVYLSPEGVVFGADSTSSVVSAEGFHFYDFNQKLFEVGEDSTLGLLTWGLGGLGPLSYRTMIATFADGLAAAPPASVAEVIQRWTDAFWVEYSKFDQFVRFQQLAAKAPYGQGAAAAANVRTPDEESEWTNLAQGLVVGFCIAGYTLPSRRPEAHFVVFQPTQPKPAPYAMPQHTLQWWGVPNFFTRLLVGADEQVLSAIQASGRWNGTRPELDSLARSYTILPNGTLPIRDAVDYVHTCIYCTVKAIKFSGLPQVCGGPIELAVITTDRKYRWVRHKPWDSAILDGEVR